jgi:plastocyanin
MKMLVLMLALLPLAAQADNHRIIQKDRRFNPVEVIIHVGDTLTFTNDDEFIHQMYSEDLFDSDEKKPGQVLVQRFDKSGTFAVQCHIHPKMKLVVHVN